MAKKATELSDLHIRRLKHHVTASGEARAKRYSVGGALRPLYSMLSAKRL